MYVPITILKLSNCFSRYIVCHRLMSERLVGGGLVGKFHSYVIQGFLYHLQGTNLVDSGMLWALTSFAVSSLYPNQKRTRRRLQQRLFARKIWGSSILGKSNSSTIFSPLSSPPYFHKSICGSRLNVDLNVILSEKIKHIFGWNRN